MSFNFSAHHFSRIFRQSVGTSVSVYLKNGQIAHAKYLLITTERTMNDVAYSAGFGTRTSFFRAFRRVTGVTPMQYRAHPKGKECD
jgi:AraC-like DNA-binding protein